jgi:hypothetical protein
VYYARASEWTVRPSPWAAADQDEFGEEDDGYAPAESFPPPPPAAPAQPLPAQPPPAPALGVEELADEELADEERADHEWLPPLFPQEWPPSTGPTEVWTPLPALRDRPPLELPRQRGPAPAPAQAVPMPGKAPPPPGRKSSATAWWIAAGVVIVALAVAAGILVGLSLAQRHSGTGVPGATCNGHPVLRATVTPVIEQAAGEIGAHQGAC